MMVNQRVIHEEGRDYYAIGSKNFELWVYTHPCLEHSN